METPRLILRGHRACDLAACAAMWADPCVIRYIFATPSTRAQTWLRMASYRGMWALLGFGYWAIEERATGAFVGEAGFLDALRDIVPPLDGTPEIGWALAPAFHGRGYAAEAMRAIVAWGDEHLAAARTACLIVPANVRSIRLAEGLGYVRTAATTFRGEPTLLFERANAARSGET
ncbi:MAG: GNAT family N-acetyltransferase [Vulcanimicrobiaceae bacterium]